MCYFPTHLHFGSWLHLHLYMRQFLLRKENSLGLCYLGKHAGRRKDWMESGSGQLEFINSYSMISSWCNLPYILQYPKLYGWFHVGTYNRPCWRLQTHFNVIPLVSGQFLGKSLHIEQVQRDPLELWRDPDHTEGCPHSCTLPGKITRHQDSGD